MIKIPPAILSDGLAELHLNQLINMENLLAHIVNRHGQNFLSVTTLIRVLGTMIESVVKWYREQGCRDVFIICYGMTPADFQPNAEKEAEQS